MTKVNNIEVDSWLTVVEHVLPTIVPSNQAIHCTFHKSRECQAKERRKLEVLLEPFHSGVILCEMDTKH